MEKVSIIMPCYNDGKYIQEAIDSVLAQTYPNIELIIIDDGSDDADTKNFLQTITDSRIQLLHSERLRPAGARNIGIAHAAGKYILPVDADDRIAPTYVEKAVAVLKENAQIGAVYCYAELFGAVTGEWALPDYKFEHMLLDNIVFVTAMFRKETWELVGGFNTNMQHGLEDYDFWLSVLEKGYEIYQIPETLFYYRIKDSSRNSILRINPRITREAYQTIYDNHVDFFAKHASEHVSALRNALIEQKFLNDSIRKAEIDSSKNSMSERLKLVLKKNRYIYLCCKGLLFLKRYGIKSMWRQISERTGIKYYPAKKRKYSKKELKNQCRIVFSEDIVFSILVPLYNTPEKYLREMIESVQAQTYAKWELCLADGSDGEHAYVEVVCKGYMNKDKRIKYRKLEQNYGISGNTNACIEMATGKYIGLFDHDDLLHPAALYEVMRVICDKKADFIYTDETTFRKSTKDAYCPHFKPDYAPDTLRANNYICHFTVFEASLLDKTGWFRSECDGSQDYDMILRLTEQAKNIVHIPIILYYWRAHSGSVATDIAAKPYVIEAAHKALQDHLVRMGLEGKVCDTEIASRYHIKYRLKSMPLVSIVIPNKDHLEDLQKCIDSIHRMTSYEKYEIIIVENNSCSKEIMEYYNELKSYSYVKIVAWEGTGFNYSAINNYGTQYADGEYIILLNNDIEVISKDWIQEMLMFAQRDDVGAVGAKLYYPDNTVQHAGVGIGLLTLAGHYHRNYPRNHAGYMGRLLYAQNMSAVTAACVMIPKKVWDEVKGLDESFAVAFNDIDLCMRIRQAGYLIVWTPFAELYHYESKSRGLEDTPEKKARFADEVKRFQYRWSKELLEGDPYYNPNLTLEKEDFSVK